MSKFFHNAEFLRVGIRFQKNKKLAHFKKNLRTQKKWNETKTKNKHRNN